MAIFKNKTILKILDYYKNLWALAYVSKLAHWDFETYMPPKGVDARGEALAKISTLRQKIFLDKEFRRLIHKAALEKDLSDKEKGIVRLLLHELKFYEKLPSTFLEEFEKQVNKSTIVWREAKEKKNYKLFENDLKKIFELNRQVAEYLGYKDSPYDALLDLFEEGLTTKNVDSFFDQIKSPLRQLTAQIVKSKKFTKAHPLENTSYDKLEMERLNLKVLKLFWPEESLRLDVSAHPFTLHLDGKDVRITTWYHDRDFGRSILATIHEFGHALYDLQGEEALNMTPIGGGSSLVLHESQSRFWENFAGRNAGFIKEFLPDMKQVLGKKNLTVDQVYSYFNKVSPGMLRVEADEVTYHFHIMLRYEIEKGLIESKLKFKDLKEIWNAKMKEYLGITPKNDAEGVLQDIHWASGMVGYFPTYSLGTFLGAQWEKEIQNNQISKYANNPMNYGKIEKWLREHIHRYGSTYTMGELLKKNGMKFDPSVNLKYLEAKYSKIYGF